MQSMTHISTELTAGSIQQALNELLCEVTSVTSAKSNDVLDVQIAKATSLIELAERLGIASSEVRAEWYRRLFLLIKQKRNFAVPYRVSHPLQYHPLERVS